MLIDFDTITKTRFEAIFILKGTLDRTKLEKILKDPQSIQSFFKCIKRLYKDNKSYSDTIDQLIKFNFIFYRYRFELLKIFEEYFPDLIIRPKSVLEDIIISVISSKDYEEIKINIPKLIKEQLVFNRTNHILIMHIHNKKILEEFPIEKFLNEKVILSFHIMTKNEIKDISKYFNIEYLNFCLELISADPDMYFAGGVNLYDKFFNDLKEIYEEDGDKEKTLLFEIHSL